MEKFVPHNYIENPKEFYIFGFYLLMLTGLEIKTEGCLGGSVRHLPSA